MRKALKSRTVWLGLLLAVSGVVQTNLEVFQLWLTPAEQGLLTMGVGVAVVVLRFLTTIPVSEK